MKWKFVEPNQGDFITEIPDNMIAWAKKNNLTVKGLQILKNSCRNNCQLH